MNKPTPRQTAVRNAPAPRRRINRVRVTVAAFVVVLLIAGAVVAILLLTAPPDGGEASSKAAMFGVTDIIVDGATQYTSDQIIQASGIEIGQSVFSLNKREAAERILQQCYYIERVTVESEAVTTLHITVEETTVIGAVPVETGYWLLGANGKALEAVAADSGQLEGRMQLELSLPEGAALGTQLLDEDGLAALSEMTDALSAYALTDIRAVDYRDLAQIRLLWRDQIVIVLNGAQDITHQIGVAAASLPSVLDKNGGDACGELKLSPFEGAAAVFSPAAEPPWETTVPTASTTQEPTGTTTAAE